MDNMCNPAVMSL